MHKDGHADLTRRDLIKTGSAVAIGGIVASVISNQNVRAHEDHLTDPDIEVEVGEFYFKLKMLEGNAVEQAENDPIHVHAGTHLIRFTNVGSVQHEIHFGNTVEMNEEGAAIGFENNLWGHFLGLHLDPGDSGMLHIHFPDDAIGGEWQIGCFIPGHFEAGQVAVLEIEGEEEEGHHDDE